MVSIATVLTAFAYRVEAACTLIPAWGDPGPAQIVPDAPFNLKFNVTSTTGDAFDSAIFDVAFSAPGIVVNSYIWGGSFHGSGYDNSNVLQGHFENFISSGPAFGEGALLSMNVILPSSAAISLNSLSVHAAPGTFALGTQEFTPQTGPDLMINIVPEPSGIALFAIGLSMTSAFFVFGRSFTAQ